MSKIDDDRAFAAARNALEPFGWTIVTTDSRGDELEVIARHDRVDSEPGAGGAGQGRSTPIRRTGA